MMQEKTYTLVCHGCGAFHEQRAIFLSAPIAYGFPGSSDTSTWTIPALGCPACMAAGKGKTDRSGPIASAFDRGATPAAVARMAAEWPAVRARLEAAKYPARL